MKIFEARHILLFFDRLSTLEARKVGLDPFRGLHALGVFPGAKPQKPDFFISATCPMNQAVNQSKIIRNKSLDLLYDSDYIAFRYAGFIEGIHPDKQRISINDRANMLFGFAEDQIAVIELIRCMAPKNIAADRITRLPADNQIQITYHPK